MTVRLVGRSRRRVRWALGGFTVVWGGLYVAALVAGLRSSAPAQILIVTGIFLAVWLPVVLIIGIRAAGSTRVGRAGLRWRAAFARGFIAWDEVVEIKDRYHKERGTGWWSVEAQLSTGRARRLPGFYCEGPPPGEFAGPQRPAEFDEQLFQLRQRLRQWQGA